MWINKSYPLSLQTLPYPGKAPEPCCWRGRAWLAHPGRTERLQRGFSYLLITLAPSWVGTLGTLDLGQDLELLSPQQQQPLCSCSPTNPSTSLISKSCPSNDLFQWQTSCHPFQMKLLSASSTINSTLLTPWMYFHHVCATRGKVYFKDVYAPIF